MREKHGYHQQHKCCPSVIPNYDKCKKKINQDKYKKNRNIINSCYYGEMPNVTKKNLIIIKSIIVWKWNHLFTKNYFRKKKSNYCYGFMPSNFQVICGSMVDKHRWLLASTETPDMYLFVCIYFYCFKINKEILPQTLKKFYGKEKNIGQACFLSQLMAWTVWLTSTVPNVGAIYRK